MMDELNQDLGAWSDYQIKEVPCRDDGQSRNRKNRSGDKVVSVKALIGPGGSLCVLPSLYLRNLSIGENRVEDSNTAAYAILAYYRFLHDDGRKFDDLTPVPQDGPLFAFRYFLCEHLKSIDAEGNVFGSFTTSTIKSYLGQISLYYEWLVNEELIEVSDEKRPLSYEWGTRNIGTNDQLLAHVYRRGEIKFKKRDLTQSLPREQLPADHDAVNPLSDDSLIRFREETKKLPNAHRLAYELQIQCGLRASETVSFSSHHIVRPDERKSYKCRIGPDIDGCKTKGRKIRTIKIPKSLMAELYEYLLSDERAKYCDSLDLESVKHPKERTRLFLTNRRGPYARSSLDGRFGEIRTSIRKQGYTFDHKDHDLRRTFATRWLARKSKDSGNSFFFCATELMRLMGHESFTSTQKYVKFLSKKSEQRKHAERTNKIAEEALRD
jgi:integrase